MKKIIGLVTIFLMSSGCSWFGPEVVKNTGITPTLIEVKAENFTYTRPQSKLYNIPITQSATCSFQRFSSAEFKNSEDPFAKDDTKKIIYESSEDSKPNIVAFVDLDTDNPKLTANGGQGDLVKIIDNDDMVTMIEKGPLQLGANTIVYTIYKKEGIATWTKQYKLLTTPYAHVAMGYCE